VDEIFVDTGIFIHLFDYQDKSTSLFSHNFIKQTYYRLLEQGNQFITTNFIISELLNNITKTVYKGNTPYKFDWLFEFCDIYIHHNLTIHLLDNTFIQTSLELCQRNLDRKYSFIDASCFAFLEKYGFVTLFTTDQNWTYYHYLKGYEIKPVSWVSIFKSLSPLSTDRTKERPKKGEEYRTKGRPKKDEG
jgi:predicted nucleic acid-binding protein